MNEVSKLFPREMLFRANDDWVAVKRDYPVGTSINGIVIDKSPFGAWVDVGMKFPALLEIINIAGLTPERYRADDWCPIGSSVTAVIAGYHEMNRQIHISQKPEHLAKGENADPNNSAH